MNISTSVVQALWPVHRIWRDAVLVVLGSFGLALVSQISVPLLPVPVTGQTFGVLLIGLLYGSRLGAFTIVAYLAEGAVGLPVFANWGSGLAPLFGLTAGYLWGFIPAAWLAGFLLERNWSFRATPMGSIVYVTLAALAGNIVIYLPGLAVLYGFLGSWQAAFAAGLLPFLTGDLLKLLLAAAVVLAAQAAVRPNLNR